MPPDIGLAQRPQQLAQRLVAQEVHALVGDFEPRLTVAFALPLTLFGLLGVDEVLLLHLFDDLVDQLFHLVRRQLVELLLRFLVEQLARLQRLPDRLPQVFHRLVVQLGELRVRILIAGVQQEVRQRLHQVLQAEGRGQVTREFGVANALHRFAPCFILDE